MNVHLIRTEDISGESYFDLLNFLQHFQGPYTFFTTEKQPELTLEDELGILYPEDEKYHKQFAHSDMLNAPILDAEIHLFRWEYLFKICNRYRKKNKVAETDVVILLTGHGNELNWFSGFDKNKKGNYFIQADIWEQYTGTDPRYPLAYQVATQLLKHHMFDQDREHMDSFHMETRGCMMDFCENKKQISIKMRTADICIKCQEILLKREVPLNKIKFSVDVMEFISGKIKHLNRYQLLHPQPDLEIRGYMQHIFLPFLGNKQVPLTPLERAVYLLFVAHPDGIRLSEFSDYKNELSAIVNKLSRSGSREQINEYIDELCSPESNSLSEKMARIKRKFIDILGEKAADPFIIKGRNGEVKSISLPATSIRKIGELNGLHSQDTI